MRLNQHVLPLLEDPRHAVLVRDGAGGRLVALAYRHDLRAIGLERRNMRPAEAEADDAHRGDALGHRSLRLLSERDCGPRRARVLPYHAALSAPAGLSSGRHRHLQAGQENTMTPIKTRLADAADALAGDLESLSHRIHAHPELGFKEVQASGWLADFLAAQGFKVERGVAGVDTAFRATIETGAGPTIAILCEYDALPDAGHACGHNVIAAAGAGAGAALAAVTLC